MPRKKQPKPLKGLDQPLFDEATDTVVVANAMTPGSADDEEAPNTWEYDPDPNHEPQRGPGPVWRFYYIKGARGRVWVHARSEKDACGTYKCSNYFQQNDDQPEATGRTKRKLGRDAKGDQERALVREGRYGAIEVFGQKEFEKLVAQRRAQQARRAKRVKKAA
jgi:hypothetical protein